MNEIKLIASKGHNGARLADTTKYNGRHQTIPDEFWNHPKKMILLAALKTPQCSEYNWKDKTITLKKYDDISEMLGVGLTVIKQTVNLLVESGILYDKTGFRTYKINETRLDHLILPIGYLFNESLEWKDKELIGELAIKAMYSKDKNENFTVAKLGSRPNIDTNGSGVSIKRFTNLVNKLKAYPDLAESIEKRGELDMYEVCTLLNNEAIVTTVAQNLITKTENKKLKSRVKELESRLKAVGIDIKKKKPRIENL